MPDSSYYGKNGFADELEAVKAIFPEAIDFSTMTQVAIVADNGNIRISIPHQLYNREGKMPTFEICAPLLSSTLKLKLSDKLRNTYRQHNDEPVLYYLVETVLLFCDSDLTAEKKLDKKHAKSHIIPDVADDGCATTAQDFSNCPMIFSGETFEDRRSVFQGHTAFITSKEEAEMVLAKLKLNSKIARATHNIYAYRVLKTFADGRVVEYKDCDCDGETGAGPKLLRLLHLMRETGIIVIVTRWYGGIHLGPDRFRHITNAARDVIINYRKMSIT